MHSSVGLNNDVFVAARWSHVKIELTPVLPTFISLHLNAASLTYIPTKLWSILSNFCSIPDKFITIPEQVHNLTCQNVFVALVLFPFPATAHSGRQCSRNGCHYHYLCPWDSPLHFSFSLYFRLSLQSLKFLHWGSLFCLFLINWWPSQIRTAT